MSTFPYIYAELIKPISFFITLIHFLETHPKWHAVSESVVKREERKAERQRAKSRLLKQQQEETQLQAENHGALGLRGGSMAPEVIDILLTPNLGDENPVAPTNTQASGQPPGNTSTSIFNNPLMGVPPNTEGGGTIQISAPQESSNPPSRVTPYIPTLNVPGETLHLPEESPTGPRPTLFSIFNNPRALSQGTGALSNQADLESGLAGQPTQSAVAVGENAGIEMNEVAKDSSQDTTLQGSAQGQDNNNNNNNNDNNNPNNPNNPLGATLPYEVTSNGMPNTGGVAGNSNMWRKDPSWCERWCINPAKSGWKFFRGILIWIYHVGWINRTYENPLFPTSELHTNTTRPSIRACHCPCCT